LKAQWYLINVVSVKYLELNITPVQVWFFSRAIAKIKTAIL